MAVVASAGMLLLALALSRHFASPAPLLLFMISVVVSAWHGGLGPGLAATGLGALAGAYFFLAPFATPAVRLPNDWVRLGAFLAAGTVMSALSEAMHRARRRAEVEAARLRNLSEERRRDRERLNLAQKAARIGWFDWIIATGENVWSPEIEALYGLAPGAFGGSYEAWRALVHPEDLPRAEADVRRAIETGEFSSEWRAVWPDGTVRRLLARAKVLADDAGRPERMIGINMDVTESRETEAALRASEQRLELALAAAREDDRRKDEFLAMLSHELRNPLAPLRNAVQILALRGDDPQVVARVQEVMERQVRQLARLVDDLLEVSRITGGKIRLQTAPLDLNDAVAGAVESVRPLIEERRHRLAVRPAAVPLRVEADSSRLAQVLANLLNNAAKYTEPGGRIELSTEVEGGAAVVRVRDDGIGIAPEMLPRVFDLFTQADGSLDRTQGGLGVGLTLVRRLVELHGGTVEAHSAGLGRGSEFAVRLPLLPAGA